MVQCYLCINDGSENCMAISLWLGMASMYQRLHEICCSELSLQLALFFYAASKAKNPHQKNQKTGTNDNPIAQLFFVGFWGILNKTKIPLSLPYGFSS